MRERHSKCSPRAIATRQQRQRLLPGRNTISQRALGRAITEREQHAERTPRAFGIQDATSLRQRQMLPSAGAAHTWQALHRGAERELHATCLSRATGLRRQR